MTFTYTPGLSAKDRVRMLIGDTDDAAQEALRLEDAEILDFLLMATGTTTPTGVPAIKRSAADAADALAAKFVRAFEGSSSGPAPSRTRAQELRATASRLRQEAGSAASPVAGGLSLSQKAVREADPDAVPSAFRKGMLDNPNASRSKPQ